jgi:hypothetical protein
MTMFGTESGYILGMVYALLGMGGVIALARYFTLKRRMVAPSIALSPSCSASSRGSWAFPLPRCSTSTHRNPDGNGGIAALSLTGYYAVFRVPFTVALIALSVYATVFGLATVLGGTFPEDADAISSC